MKCIIYSANLRKSLVFDSKEIAKFSLSLVHLAGITLYGMNSKWLQRLGQARIAILGVGGMILLILGLVKVR